MDLLVLRSRADGRRVGGSNPVEDAMISVLGSNNAEVLRDIQRKERSHYATGRHFSDKGRIIPSLLSLFDKVGASSSGQGAVQGGQGAVHTRDAYGKAVE